MWRIRGDLRKEDKIQDIKYKIQDIKYKIQDIRAHQSSIINHPFCHFLPGQVRGEGFFMAVLRKHGTEESDSEDDAESPKALKRKKKDKRKGNGDAASALTVLPTDVLDEAGAPRVELSLEEAIRYLQREALVLPAETPRGIVQVCFRGQRLGLMKNLGTRANNLYPKEWRIRSGYAIPHTLFA